LADYLNTESGMHLVPPWSPEYDLPAFADQRHAREFWRRINLAVANDGEASAVRDFSKKILAAERRGARSELQNLETERLQLAEQLATQARAQLRAASTNPQELALIDLNAALAKVSFTNRVARAALLRQVAAHLGEVKSIGGQPGADVPGAFYYGTASQHGLLIELSWMQLNDAAVELPALADWLGDQHCIGFKYDLTPGAGAGGPDDDDE
jgi:hypothetical protein